MHRSSAESLASVRGKVHEGLQGQGGKVLLVYEAKTQSYMLILRVDDRVATG